jgi:DNA-directed RNA polymerase subunit beta'
LKSGDFISKNLIVSDSGFIERNTSNQIYIRIAKPFLFSKAASTYYVNNDFIQENDILGITFYKIAQTGDIVQGLPKIEEILEARKTQFKIKSFKDPHLFFFLKMFKVIKMNKEKTFNIFFAVNKFGLQIDKFESKKIFINSENFLNVGRPVNNNFSNPHYELIYLNEYFKEFLDPYKAAYRTLKKIQYQIINIIQIIYSSQNVIIADKHVEIIIKKMTSKVIILSKGDSDVSTGQYIDLATANSINKILSRTKSKKILYRPVLFGITKASLTTKSFISSASFQQTIKVLTHAAIQGKVDWLKGLKENVIVGRLIPAGTGFNSYEDISYLNIRIF